MSENYASEQHFDFSGGMQQAVGRIIASDNEYPLLINGWLPTVGPITKVKGYTQQGSDVNTNYEILGLAGGYKTTGVTKLIAVANGASNSDAYTYNTATDAWTPHGLGLSTGSKAEFEFFLDGFFMVNFTEVTRFNDYTQWYTTTNVTSAPKAKYIKQYLSRIYLAYVVDGASTYPSRVIYSDLPSDTSPQTISWNNAVNFFDVDVDDGDVIKGLEVNANRLLVFKENAMYRYDTNTLYKVPGAPGTVSQRSVKNLQGQTLYLHSSGIWMYDGTTSRLISRKIRDIINGITTNNLDDACAYSTEDHYYLSVGDVVNSEKGINIPHCLIDYDISKNAFSVRSLINTPTIFAKYRDNRSATTYNDANVSYNSSSQTYNGLITTEDRVFFGDTLGAVYQINKSNSFDGTDIAFSLETKDYYLGNPSTNKLFQKVQVYVDGIRSMTFQYRVDDGNWKTLGKVTNSQTELIFPSGTRGRRIKFRVLESSSGDPFVFEGFDIFYTPETLIT